jgi:signal recognition particle subunit SEC65
MGIYYDAHAMYGVKIDLSDIETCNDYEDFVASIEEICSRLGLSYISASPHYDCGYPNDDFVVGLSVKDKTSEEVISIMEEVDEKLKEMSWNLTPKLYSLLDVS